MAEWSLGEIAGFVLVILALVVVGLVMTGTFDITQERFAEIYENINITFGGDDLEGEKPELTKKQKAEVTDFVNTIESMVKADGGNCFMKYDSLTTLDEVAVVMVQNGKDIVVRVKAGAGNVQDAKTSFTIANASLCVVAGDNVAESFYDSFLEPSEERSGEYVRKVNTVVLPAAEVIYYDGVEGDFEDGSWLFKGPAGEICFFPTSDVYTSEEGLHDAYLQEDGEESVAAGLGKNLVSCKVKERLQRYKSIEIEGIALINQPKEIAQVCEGFVTKSCESKHGCDGKVGLSYASGNGCAVLAVHDKPAQTNCGTALVAPGEVLYPFGMEILENAGLSVVDGSLRSVGRTNEVLQNPLWKSFPAKSLLCAGTEWVQCDPLHIGAEQTVGGKKFVCSKDREGFAYWEEPQ